MRVRRPRTRALAYALVLAALPPSTAARAQETALDRWYQGLRELRPDPARGAMVEGLSFSRDAGIFQFGPGQLQLLAAIDGRTVGAVYIGAGRFQLAPPEAIEQGQIQRAFASSVVDVPFRTAVLLFSEATLSVLENAAATPIVWGALPPHRDAARELEEAREYFTDDEGWLDPKLALPLVNGGPGFFYAHFAQDRGDPLIYSVDPNEFEEISLSRRTEEGRAREVITQFHRRADYASGASAPQTDLDALRVDRYDADLEVADNLDFSGRAAVTLARARDGFDWVAFALHPVLELDSVRWADGSAAETYRAEESWDVWVNTSRVGADATQLVFSYSGELLDRLQGRLWIQLATHNGWLPTYPTERPVPYRLAFETPEDLVVTAVGTQVAETTADERTTRVFETPPVRLVTFNIGEFERLDTEPAGAPRLTVLVDEEAHTRLGQVAQDAGLFLREAEDMTRIVANDLTNSFRYFSDIYGATPLQQMVATEIPYSHGEAYPGLVMLSWSTFQVSDDQGLDDMFRAHEVAHQWWGISVRPATYRDRWLAEGFSEFSGWWYGAATLGSIDLYRRRLRETREAILLRRDRAAPVGLGTRVANSRNPEDYATTIYEKSAWVLHMLRVLLTDPDTDDDGAFRRLMRTFHTTYAGADATTRDFQAVAEQVVGVDLRWFFDQWVYGSAIPTYTFSYQLNDLPDGTVAGRVRIRQEDVPDNFQMIVPILLDFGAEGTAVVRVNVRGPLTESDLPPLPRRPERIVFNPDESVLAETRTEGWRN